MNDSPDSVRSEILGAARRLSEAGLSHGTSGNVSARSGAHFLVTPSALSYERMEAADLVELTGSGEIRSGRCRPSTEWPVHAAVYEERPEVGAIVHAHPPYATAFSNVRSEIPPFHYMVAAVGGRSIRCAGFAAPGSPELARETVAALAGRRACLLANHGLVAVGDSVGDAFRMALEVENLSRQYWLTLQIGPPELLSDEEMDSLLSQFEVYGEETG